MNSAHNFIKKETMAQLFSCEFFEIFKNTFFTGYRPEQIARPMLIERPRASKTSVTCPIFWCAHSAL